MSTEAILSSTPSVLGGKCVYHGEVASLRYSTNARRVFRTSAGPKCHRLQLTGVVFRLFAEHLGVFGSSLSTRGDCGLSFEALSSNGRRCVVHGESVPH